MNSVLSVLLVSWVTLLRGNELQAANVTSAEVQQQQQEHRHSFKNIQIIKDIKAFIQQNPHVRLIPLHKKAPSNHQSQSVKYTLGNRIAGDRMVAQYADTFYYRTLEDVSVQVTYPDTGAGGIVTSVDINCLQDNVNGNAYVVAGGVQQRFISIVLEATQTKRFTYNVHVYGTD